METQIYMELDLIFGLDSGSRTRSYIFEEPDLELDSKLIFENPDLKS
jgi:hypothetical protein